LTSSQTVAMGQSMRSVHTCKLILPQKQTAMRVATALCLKDLKGYT